MFDPIKMNKENVLNNSCTATILGKSNSMISLPIVQRDPIPQELVEEDIVGKCQNIRNLGGNCMPF